MSKKNILWVMVFAFWIPCFGQEIQPAKDQNKISLDIKGMDIVDVLKTLSSRAGMNVVVGKNVTGRATLFLKDVDVRDVFEIVILANDLAYEEKSGIINVMTQKDYELLYGERFQDKKQAKVIPLKYARAADLSKTLAQMKANTGKIVVDEGSNTLVLMDSPLKLKEMESFVKSADVQLETRIFNLNYAQADKISAKIQDTVTKGVGLVRIDERTNKVAVSDYAQKLDEVAKIIAAFDEKTPQVLIDAQIIEVKLSDKFEMGVDWDYWLKKNFKVTASLPVGTSNRLLLGTALSSITSQGDYKAVLDLLRTIGNTKILSSPRIMALNNQEAKILVGTKDAYITSTTSQGGTGTAVTSQSVNFVDVGIKLYVTPTVNADGFVTMKIKPEISSAERTSITSEGKITQIPIVTTSEAETAVMVKDGITVIIGGLRKDERKKEVKKIPLIADIPLVGFFFRSTSDETKKTELVILLTPHIMSGENPYSDFAEIKPLDGAVLKMQKGNIIAEKISPNPSDTYAKYNKYVGDKVMALAAFTETKGEKGEVEVSFSLDSEGRLTGEPKITSSTNSKIDRAAIGCVKSASPFQRFPKDLDKKEEIFTITLAYR